MQPFCLGQGPRSPSLPSLRTLALRPQPRSGPCGTAARSHLQKNLSKLTGYTLFIPFGCYPPFSAAAASHTCRRAGRAGKGRRGDFGSEEGQAQHPYPATQGSSSSTSDTEGNVSSRLRNEQSRELCRLSGRMSTLSLQKAELSQGRRQAGWHGTGWRCSSLTCVSGCASCNGRANTQPNHKRFILKNTAKFMHVR